MHATLETRIIQANQGDSFVDVFASLVQDELDCRHSRLIESRFHVSGLKERPTLTEFDWGFNPKLPKKEIYEVVSGKFIRDGDDVLLIGSPGTRKSHIAKTTAQAAIQTGYKVVYRQAHTYQTFVTPETSQNISESNGHTGVVFLLVPYAALGIALLVMLLLIFLARLVGGDKAKQHTKNAFPIDPLSSSKHMKEQVPSLEWPMNLNREQKAK